MRYKFLFREKALGDLLEKNVKAMIFDTDEFTPVGTIEKDDEYLYVHTDLIKEWIHNYQYKSEGHNIMEWREFS